MKRERTGAREQKNQQLFAAFPKHRSVGVGRIFSSEGAIPDFCRGGQTIFPAGGQKVMKFHFSHSKLTKQPLLLKISQENVKF